VLHETTEEERNQLKPKHSKIKIIIVL